MIDRENNKDYSRQEDLERLMDALGISKHARPISPASVFEMALEEIKTLKARDAAVNEPLRQAAIKMQVAVGNVMLFGGTEPEKWIETLFLTQGELARQTNACRSEFEVYYDSIGLHEIFKN